MITACDTSELVRTVRVKVVNTEWELDAVRRLRRAVFCDEQRIFVGDDLDEIDAHALPIAAVLSMPGTPDEVIGTVRIHQEQPGLWYGSRLAVARPVRRLGAVGSGLIKLAVGIAHARGCTTFLAHVQSQNAPLFERLHWSTLEQLDMHGRPHHLMQADLDCYPPLADSGTCFVLPRGDA